VHGTEVGKIGMKILVITKRQYMNKDLLNDRFGRFREIPLALAEKGHEVVGLCLSYQARKERRVQDGSVYWKSINATKSKSPGLLRFLLEASLIARKSDVIWACSDSFYGVIGCVLGKIYRVPMVFDIYDNFGNFAVAR
jgi:teichuronic acid biosynthesis glycosyltransferase TuaC